MNRRRILTGMVAAPFVARLGLLMPVRPVLSMRQMLANSGALDFEAAWPIHQDVYSRVHYAIGIDGSVRVLLDHELVDGRRPRLRPDHPLAQIDGQWDFTTLAESRTLGPAQYSETDPCDEA